MARTLAEIEEARRWDAFADKAEANEKAELDRWRRRRRGLHGTGEAVRAAAAGEAREEAAAPRRVKRV